MGCESGGMGAAYQRHGASFKKHGRPQGRQCEAGRYLWQPSIEFLDITPSCSQSMMSPHRSSVAMNILLAQFMSEHHVGTYVWADLSLDSGRWLALVHT
jgi:hypothetical protein